MSPTYSNLTGGTRDTQIIFLLFKHILLTKISLRAKGLNRTTTKTHRERSDQLLSYHDSENESIIRVTYRSA